VLSIGVQADTAPEPPTRHEEHVDPEHEAVLADSPGLALLVALDTPRAGRTAGIRAARHVRGAVRRDRRDPQTPPNNLPVARATLTDPPAVSIASHIVANTSASEPLIQQLRNTHELLSLRLEVQRAGPANDVANAGGCSPAEPQLPIRTRAHASTSVCVIALASERIDTMRRATLASKFATHRLP